MENTMKNTMENTMENIEEKPAIDKFFYILNSQFTKRPMHFDRTAIEAILRMRGRLITEAEKETDSTNKELMIKEIERIDNNIAEYKTKCIQYFKEIDPELEGYEPYDEQPEKEAGGESEKPTKKGERDEKGLTYTERRYIDLFELTYEYIKKNGGFESQSVNQSVIMIYNDNKKKVFKKVEWANDSLNGYYYKGQKLNIKTQ